jgi:hypothetical protein
VCVYERERLASTSAADKTITKDRYLNSFMMKAWPGVKIEKFPTLGVHRFTVSIYVYKFIFAFIHHSELMRIVTGLNWSFSVNSLCPGAYTSDLGLCDNLRIEIDCSQPCLVSTYLIRSLLVWIICTYQALFPLAVLTGEGKNNLINFTHQRVHFFACSSSR